MPDITPTDADFRHSENDAYGKANRSLLALVLLLVICALPSNAAAELKVGAAVIDITPERLPVVVSGSFVKRWFGTVISPLSARAIVIDDGETRIGMLVVDTCLTPQPLCDEVKKLVAKQTSIPQDRILISATHCHTAPSLGDNLVSPDENYVEFVREKLVSALVTAESRLEPAAVGWGAIDAGKYTAVRRWIRRTDRVENDVFGNPTVKAHMHAAANWDNVTGPSGPEDPELSLISFQGTDGRPLAVLANFSMHYFGDAAGLSSDYYGLFCDGLKRHLQSNAASNKAPFVGIMSHGCSGDIWRADYTQPPASRYMPEIDEYTQKMVDLAMEAYQTIEHRRDADLQMVESRLPLNYRVPDQQRLQWAQQIIKKMGPREPETQEEAYAREQIALHQDKSAEVVVQAIRIGDIAIAALSTETYALTGLKIKLQSPFEKTMVIELANGSHGYLPSPAQHYLGGYNTWPMRGAGLEVQAEPIITAAVLGQLEKVTKLPRRSYQQSRGLAVQQILDAQPVAYWRLDDFEGPVAEDSSGQNRHAVYEPGLAYFLKGPRSGHYGIDGEQNRAVHFAGGRLRTQMANLGSQYSIALWFWNGMPLEARETAGWLLSRGTDRSIRTVGDHVGIGGTTHPGRVTFMHSQRMGSQQLVAGQTEIKRWTWNHLVFVRDGRNVRIHLNGASQPEIETSTSSDSAGLADQLFIGGRCDNQSNWEGRLDEVAVFDRALSADEIQAFAAAGLASTADSN